MSEQDPFAHLRGVEKLKDDDRNHVWQQIASKAWDDIGVLEREDGRLLFPEFIYRRDPKTGKFVGDPIVLEIPRGAEIRKARIEAYSIFKEEHLDPEKDRSLFEDTEQLCTLWYAIRSPKGPYYEPLVMEARELEKRYDRPSLEQINGKLEQYRRVLDPKLGGMNGEEMAAVSAALVARQNLAPLFAFDNATQEAYFITMARLHLAYLKARSSPGLSDPSTAD